jgi:hypothetical protein
VDASTGTELQSEPIHLALVNGARPNQVTISHSRRSILVNGGTEPFLPVGWFAGNENLMTTPGLGALDADIRYIEALAEQGVNMVMLYGTGWQGTPVPLNPAQTNRTLALMDAAWDVGLRVQLCMPGLAGVFRVDNYTAHHSMGLSTFTALDEYLAAVSIHPALLGYCEYYFVQFNLHRWYLISSSTR